MSEKIHRGGNNIIALKKCFGVVALSLYGYYTENCLRCSQNDSEKSQSVVKVTQKGGQIDKSVVKMTTEV